METSVQERLLLGDFTPRNLTFIHGLNCVLASNSSGKTRCIDVVTGEVQEYIGILECACMLKSNTRCQCYW